MRQAALTRIHTQDHTRQNFRVEGFFFSNSLTPPPPAPLSRWLAVASTLCRSLPSLLPIGYNPFVDPSAHALLSSHGSRARCGASLFHHYAPAHLPSCPPSARLARSRPRRLGLQPTLTWTSHVPPRPCLPRAHVPCAWGGLLSKPCGTH